MPNLAGLNVQNCKRCGRPREGAQCDCGYYWPLPKPRLIPRSTDNIAEKEFTEEDKKRGQQSLREAYKKLIKENPGILPGCKIFNEIRAEIKQEEASDDNNDR